MTRDQWIRLAWLIAIMVTTVLLAVEGAPAWVMELVVCIQIFGYVVLRRPNR